MDFKIKIIDVAEMSFQAFEDSSGNEISRDIEKENNFITVCDKLDFIFRCWQCTGVSVEVNKDNDIVISMNSMDAMVLNRYFKKGEDIEGLGETDKTFYDVCKHVKLIEFSSDSDGLVTRLIFPGIWK